MGVQGCSAYWAVDAHPPGLERHGRGLRLAWHGSAGEVPAPEAERAGR